MKCSLGISNFLEQISSVSHSVVFLYFFSLIIEEGFLSLLAILWNSAFKWYIFIDLENKLMVARGKDGRKELLGSLGHVHTTIF